MYHGEAEKGCDPDIRSKRRASCVLINDSKKHSFCTSSTKAPLTYYIYLLTFYQHVPHVKRISPPYCRWCIVMRDVDGLLNVAAIQSRQGLEHPTLDSSTCYRAPPLPSPLGPRPLLPVAMSFLANPFLRPSRAQNAWFPAGLTSSYPNLDDSMRVSEQRPCGGKFVPGCRVFHVPQDDSSKATEISIDDWKDPDLGGNAKDQVMVFQYKGKFIAVNHVGGKSKEKTVTSPMC